MAKGEEDFIKHRAMRQWDVKFGEEVFKGQ